MTPKEKADKIFSEMYKAKDPLNSYPMCFDTAKQCALIAVDEILIIQEYWGGINNTNYEYWQEVKQEIEKL